MKTDNRVHLIEQPVNTGAAVARNAGIFYHYLRRSDSLDSPILSPQKITSKIAAIKKICAIYNKADMPDDIYILSVIINGGSYRDIVRY